MNETLSEIFKDYPHITVLGDGEYTGLMSGHIITINGIEYYCSDGVRGLNCKVTVKVTNGKDELYFY